MTSPQVLALLVVALQPWVLSPHNLLHTFLPFSHVSSLFTRLPLPGPLPLFPTTEPDTTSLLKASPTGKVRVVHTKIWSPFLPLFHHMYP
ncbi:MAG: hypothetical protein J3Q66DRAFT_347851, partial [Benniella sp.]